MWMVHEKLCVGHSYKGIKAIHYTQFYEPT